MGALIANPRPRRVSTCVHEAYMCLTATGAVSALMEGGLSYRLGVNRYVPTFPAGSYRTRDGWLGVTALTPAQWRAFCRLLDHPELADEPRYATAVERLLLANEIDPLVAEATPARSTDAWVQGGLEGRIPLTPMADLAQLPHVSHWRERGAFGPFDNSGAFAPTLPYRAEFTGHPAPPLAGGPIAAPLKGLKVRDFSMGWAGPLCARTLADLGAEVVKIESESHPDWWRGWEADQSGDPPPRETKFSFISVNRNKRGIILDLTQPEGLAQAKALIARADVVVENFAAGIMESLGLGPEAAVEALQAAGVPAAPVYRVDQLGYDPQLASTGFWPEMDRAYVGRHITPAAPFAYDGVRPALRFPSPTLGEHTAEVLAELGAVPTPA